MGPEHFPRKSPPGPTGSRFEHWGTLRHSDEGRRLAAVVLTRLLLTEAPPAAVAAHLSAALAALAKPAGGVRPVAVGSVLRRIVTKAVCKAFAPELRDAAGPRQFAIGRPGGIEILFKAMGVLAEMRPRAAFVKLDFENAFNATDRVAVQRAVDARLPALSRVAQTLLPPSTFHYWHGEAPDAETVQAERGVDQGCPLSPALFAIAIAAFLEELRGAAPGAAVFAYLDDVYLVVAPEHAVAACDAAEALAAPLGLRLNRGKCAVWAPQADTALPEIRGIPRAASLTCLGATLPYTPVGLAGRRDLAGGPPTSRPPPPRARSSPPTSRGSAPTASPSTQPWCSTGCAPKGPSPTTCAAPWSPRGGAPRGTPRSAASGRASSAAPAAPTSGRSSSCASRPAEAACPRRNSGGRRRSLARGSSALRRSPKP